jgi:hypothetical protein
MSLFIKKILFFIIALCFTSQMSLAAEVTVKGHATVDYEGGVFSSEVPKKIKKKARKKAIKKAWKKYIAKLDPAKRKAYMSMEDDFLDELHEYMSWKVVETEVDEDDETVTVYIRAEVDDGLVQTKLNASMPKAVGEGEMFGFLFVTRQQGSIKQKEDKVTSIASAESMHAASEKVKASGGSVASLDKEKAKAKTVTGGNTISSSETATWRIQPSKEVDGAVTQTLATAGYKPTKYAYLARHKKCGSPPYPEEIRKEFATKMDMSSETEAVMVEVANACGVPFLGVGTLDIMKASIDPVTGKKLVIVSVIARVMDTSGMFAQTIGSIGPVQFRGLGIGEQDARNNAIIKASKDLAEKLVNQLGAR